MAACRGGCPCLFFQDAGCRCAAVHRLFPADDENAKLVFENYAVGESSVWSATAAGLIAAAGMRAHRHAATDTKPDPGRPVARPFGSAGPGVWVGFTLFFLAVVPNARGHPLLAGTAIPGNEARQSSWRSTSGALRRGSFAGLAKRIEKRRCACVDDATAILMALATLLARRKAARHRQPHALAHRSRGGHARPACGSRLDAGRRGRSG